MISFFYQKLFTKNLPTNFDDNAIISNLCIHVYCWIFSEQTLDYGVKTYSLGLQCVSVGWPTPTDKFHLLGGTGRPSQWTDPGG